MKQIKQDRNGDHVDKSLLKSILDIFVEIDDGETNLYKEDFEVDLLEDAKDYYACKAESWFEEEQNQVEEDYISKVNSKIVLWDMEVKMFLQLSNSVSNFTGGRSCGKGDAKYFSISSLKQCD